MNKESLYVRSVLKALLVLEQFNDQGEKGINQLSVCTGLPASTVQRIVNTLELKNYLMQNPKTNKYRLGFALYNISKNFSEDFSWVEAARCHLEKLVQKHKETVNLAVLQGNNIVYLTKVDSPHILRPNFKVGTKYPAYCTSLGKCLLAHLPPEILNRFISTTPLEPYTENTITDPEKLKTELYKTRERGYAVDDEEFQDGLYCLAAPVKNRKGKVVAAISFTAPKTRMPAETLPEIINDLLKAAGAISAEITS
ncbi:MAG: IclR family transcriptional regulator [Firmicutes bacterium]|nr:IclR family transcriptional regulator [Bacillota bacterium]